MIDRLERWAFRWLRKRGFDIDDNGVMGASRWVEYNERFPDDRREL